VIVRLAVTPPDADVFVDGLRAGSASEPLELPRSTRSRTLRFEKRGFEPHSQEIVPDHDRDLPPVALRVLHEGGAEPIPTASRGPSGTAEPPADPAQQPSHPK
jgi:hypothetical protein